MLTQYKLYQQKSSSRLILSSDRVSAFLKTTCSPESYGMIGLYRGGPTNQDRAKADLRGDFSPVEIQKLPSFTVGNGKQNPHLPSAIPGRTRNERLWSCEEVIILLYFTSRHIVPCAMQCLLAHRGYDRSTAAIDDMVWHIAVKWPSLRPVNGKWDVRAVDRWIDDQINDHECVNQIIQFSIRDADAVASIQSINNLLLVLDSLNPYQTAF